MSMLRSIGLHIGLTVAATLTAVSVWTEDEELTKEAAASVQVYSGTPAKLESLRFESKRSKVEIVPKRDDNGEYYVVKVDEESGAAAEAEDAHGHGHGHDPHGAEKEESKASAAPKPRERRAFIAVDEGSKLVKGFAPLLALRAIGRIEKARAEEFGFDEPQGTIIAKIAGKEHKLEVGGTTPGGRDRYARLQGTHEAYAIEGDLVNGLMHASSRLLERDLHAFEEDEVTRVVISKGGERRELSKLEGKASGWASAATPTTQDETAGNWMAKLGRLRVSKYLEEPPKGISDKDTVVVVEYFAQRRKLGTLTLLRQAQGGGEPRYLVRSEQTRWYVEVVSSAAEQVDQDLGSVLRAGK